MANKINSLLGGVYFQSSYMTSDVSLLASWGPKLKQSQSEDK